MEKSFPWIDFNNYIVETKNKKYVQLFFESKFDETLKYTPNKLYHITNIENISKIKKNGLYPLFFEKGDFRPDRIYFSLNLNDSRNILSKMILNNKLKGTNNSYVMCEILTKDINNLVLYKDPRSNSVYTYNHINPKYIKIVNENEE